MISRLVNRVFDSSFFPSLFVLMLVSGISFIALFAPPNQLIQMTGHLWSVYGIISIGLFVLTAFIQHNDDIVPRRIAMMAFSFFWPGAVGPLILAIVGFAIWGIFVGLYKTYCFLPVVPALALKLVARKPQLAPVVSVPSIGAYRDNNECPTCHKPS